MWSTAWCSIADVVIWLPARASCCANATPLIAALIDSVPPLVKTTSFGLHPSSSATVARAWSMALAASLAMAYVAEGLPKASEK